MRMVPSHFQLVKHHIIRELGLFSKNYSFKMFRSDIFFIPSIVSTQKADAVLSWAGACCTPASFLETGTLGQPHLLPLPSSVRSSTSAEENIDRSRNP